MAVPDALCIIFACPVVTIILSALLLRDKITLVKVESGLQFEVLMLIVKLSDTGRVLVGNWSNLRLQAALHLHQFLPQNC